MDLGALPVSRGHFVLESGRHAEAWFDLDQIFVDAAAMTTYAASLASRLTAYAPEVVCGPLIGGAFVAQALAAHLGIDFAYAERRVFNDAVEYLVPSSVISTREKRRWVVVDDAVSGGSALVSLIDCLAYRGIKPVAAGALLKLGSHGARRLTKRGIPWFALKSLDYQSWSPEQCPHCAAGAPCSPLPDPFR